ncbi:hypothetical protein [Paracoccus sp. 22332]|uniref:hypothetical protein n=1 Tax=Paracoccus sp. 22332 TaxID=3453913 RepID=UPI003F86F47C
MNASFYMAFGPALAVSGGALVWALTRPARPTLLHLLGASWLGASMITTGFGLSVLPSGTDPSLFGLLLYLGSVVGAVVGMTFLGLLGALQPDGRVRSTAAGLAGISAVFVLASIFETGSPEFDRFIDRIVHALNGIPFVTLIVMLPICLLFFRSRNHAAS